jgi:hypothetical protein
MNVLRCAVLPKVVSRLALLSRPEGETNIRLLQHVKLAVHILSPSNDLFLHSVREFWGWWLPHLHGFVVLVLYIVVGDLFGLGME